MTETVFITGCSTGIGRATAGRFHSEGWTVYATMRDPSAAGDLTELERLHLLPLDVTDVSSISAAVDVAIAGGGIDVLVNNAGYGAYGALESTPREKVVRQFNTNVLGLIDTTKAVLPHFRQRGRGVVVNVSSLGGRVAWPLGSLYHATKFAVEGLSEALSYELDAIGVRMKIVEPGRVATDFNGRSIDVTVDPEALEYAPLIQALQKGAGEESYRTDAEYPARVIFRAATDDSDQLRYVSGDDALEGISMRAELSDEALHAHIKKQFGLD